ncbi:hypothetical protein E3N88_07018 [Mikania micrantha]|uniref:Uncharacterized protein n=1 Tax=Mikania micrantha TaxID=192012 RepID=A0A5N6PRE3_9ASTR|nr:hypothetical protein E3N88_07018 [Mikania micrantha]
MATMGPLLAHLSRKPTHQSEAAGLGQKNCQGPNEANNPTKDIGAPIHKIYEPCNSSSPAKHQGSQAVQLTRNETQKLGHSKQVAAAAAHAVGPGTKSQDALTDDSS